MSEPDEFSAALGIAPDAIMGRHYREKNSFRGISTRTSLWTLIASAVNQDFVKEICQLTQLEDLALEWPTTALSLASLQRLTRLKKTSHRLPREHRRFHPNPRDSSPHPSRPRKCQAPARPTLDAPARE